MPDLRALIVALGVGLGASAYTILWWHWAVIAGAGVGIILGGLAIVGSVSIGPKPADADAAWREAAPEFLDPPAGPADSAPSGDRPDPTPDGDHEPPTGLEA